MISVIEEERERVHAELMNSKTRSNAVSGGKGPGAAPGQANQPSKHFLFDAPPTADCEGLKEFFRDDYARVAEDPTLSVVSAVEDVDAHALQSADYARRVQECLRKIEADLTDIIGWTEPRGGFESGTASLDSGSTSKGPRSAESKFTPVCDDLLHPNMKLQLIVFIFRLALARNQGLNLVR
jgi:hypothetical protein